MTTVDFIPFANDASSANVVTQSDYLAAASGSGYVQNGFTSGTAASNKVNKSLRQSSVMTAALANFISARLGASVLDSGGASSVTAITAQILSAIQNSSFPTSTAVLFAQTAAPTGWTKSTSHNDKMLRVVSGTAGSGGSAALSTAWTSVSLSGTVAGHALTITEMPSHTHSGTTGNQNQSHTHTTTAAGAALVDYGTTVNVARYVINTPSGSESVNHTHDFTTAATGSGTSHDHGLTINAFTVTPAYLDVIVATKNA